MAKSDPEWIEIYNSTDQNIDLNGWKVKDGKSSDSDDLSLNGTISSKGFLTFEHSKGWLNDSGGETITLLDNNSQSMDSYTYQTATEEKTFARVPDDGDWQSNQDSTKNSSNLVISNTSTPTPTSSPTATSTQSPTNTPSSSKSDPTFNISTSNQAIAADQSLDLNISIQNLDSNTIFYLKGAFLKSGSSNYFGKTFVSSSWVKNSQTYSDQLKITTDKEGNWIGTIKVMPDSDDSGFTGTDDYILKAGRYTSDGSGPTWSNELTIHINQTVSQNATPTIKSSPTLIPAQNVLGTSKSNISPSSYPESSTSVKIPENLMASYSASLENSSSSTNKSESLVPKPFKLTLGIILGSLAVLAGIGLGGFYFLKLRT